MPPERPEPTDGSPALEPVLIEIRQECAFKAKPCRTCGKPKSNAIHRKKNVQEGKPFCAFKRQNGCASCGAPKKDRRHIGALPSINMWGQSGSGFTYINLKEQWEEALVGALRDSKLPTGLGRVFVEAEAVFPARANRDQGNFRALIEKALGDALQAGGWLVNDDWDSYEFGNLRQSIEPGVSATRLVLFPHWPTAPAQGVLQAA